MNEAIITKICTKCKRVKSLSEYRKDHRSKSDYQSWCKACADKCILAYNKTGKGKQARRHYSQSEKGVLVRKRYRQSEKGKQNHKRDLDLYEKTEKGKQARYLISKKYRENTRHKAKARNAVNHSIQAGKMLRADRLQCCCGLKAEQYHHKDYESKNGLNVIPICVSCHTRIHNFT